MTWLRVVALGFLVLVFGNPSPSPAGTIPNTQLHHQATLVTTTQIMVGVDFVCQEGTTTSVFAQASQPNAGLPDTNGSGFTFDLLATGQRQTAAVLVTAFSGVWSIGDATATASVFCGGGAFGRDSGKIVIDLP